MSYFIKRFSLKHRRPTLKLSKDALKALERYHWPGNVRELENFIERLVIFTNSNEISLEDLEMAGLTLPDGLDDRKEDLTPRIFTETTRFRKGIVSLDELERRYVLEVLESVGGNKTLAAQLLGIDRKTLRLKLKRWEQTKQATSTSS